MGRGVGAREGGGRWGGRWAIAHARATAAACRTAVSGSMAGLREWVWVGWGFVGRGVGGGAGDDGGRAKT